MDASNGKSSNASVLSEEKRRPKKYGYALNYVSMMHAVAKMGPYMNGRRDYSACRHFIGWGPE